MGVLEEKDSKVGKRRNTQIGKVRIDGINYGKKGRKNTRKKGNHMRK